MTLYKIIYLLFLVNILCYPMEHTIDHARKKTLLAAYTTAFAGFTYSYFICRPGPADEVDTCMALGITTSIIYAACTSWLLKKAFIDSLGEKSL